MYSQFKSPFDIILPLLINPMQQFIRKPFAPKHICHHSDRRHPDNIRFRHHLQCLLRNIIPMLHAVRPGPHQIGHRPGPIRMTHHRKPLFMCNMHHLLHFLKRKRLPRNSPIRIKIHDSRSHDLNKIPPACFNLPHKLRILPHIFKSLPHNPPITPFPVYGKNRRPVINPILRRNLPCPFRDPQIVPSIPHKRNPLLPIHLKMPPDHPFIHPIQMPLHSLFVIYSIHKHMRMTLPKHPLPLDKHLLCPFCLPNSIHILISHNPNILLSQLHLYFSFPSQTISAFRLLSS